MKSRSIDAVIFDLFHTLVDPEEFRPKEFHRAEVAADILGVERARFVSVWQGSYQERMKQSKPDAEWFKEVLSGFGRQVPESVILRAEFEVRRYQEMAVLNPPQDVVTSVKKLKAEGYALGLLSNCFEGEVRAWPGSPLAPYFDSVVFSSDVGMVKPDPKVFLHSLKGLGVKGQRCVFVGDGGSDELPAAKGVGIRHTILSRRFVPANGLRTPDEVDRLSAQADSVVSDYLGLGRLIAGLDGR